jgi:hypothetical protein
MWERTKFLAFVICIGMWGLVAIGMAKGSSSLNSGPIRPSELKAARVRHQEPNRLLVLAPLALQTLAGVVLMVDALRRDYDGPKAWPVVIGCMGAFTLGLLSIPYYLIWGRLPTKREVPLAQTLCPRCVDETVDRPAPGTGTHNAIGSALVGRASVCSSCGSSIKTLWIVFMIPLIPLASYRILPQGEASLVRAAYIGRKRRDGLYWPQVLPYLLVAACVIGGFAWAASRS